MTMTTDGRRRAKVKAALASCCWLVVVAARGAVDQ